MEYYSECYTNKFPYRHVVNSPMYFVFTTNKRKYIRLLQQIKRNGITEFSPQQVNKLSIAGFTVTKKG